MQAECLQGMYRQQLYIVTDEQPNIQKELNASISMISVQYNNWYKPEQEVYQVTRSANFAPSAVHPRYKSEVNQPLATSFHCRQVNFPHKHCFGLRTKLF